MKTLLAIPAALLSFALASFAGDLAPTGPAEDGTRPALVKIAGEATLNSMAFDYLTGLSDEVGGRLTGSPEDHRSAAWAVTQMKRMGLHNVHLEPYSIWKGWTRGKAEAQLLAPIHRPLTVDAMGWTGSTPGPVEADVVTANIFDLDTELQNLSRFRGKIVLMSPQGAPKKSFWVIFAQFGDFLDALHKAGAVAVIGGQGGFKSEGMHLTHTGILGFAKDFALPVVDMTREDQGQLERYIASGKTVRIRVDVQNSLTASPVESANVVGEIPGREFPDQVLVVGAHLDSWDLSLGSTDNGVGSACVLAAAEAILRSGQQPRRTIRFVLFTGEEQGLLGSMAYVSQHKDTMANHIGSLVIDAGQGPIKEFQLGGRSDLLAAFQPFARFLGNLREIKVTDDTEFGTDTGPFTLAGLPAINLAQDSPDYKFTHHSGADAPEAVKADVITQDAAILALTSFWLADRPDRFAAPWPAERTARMLREKGDFEMLNAFHIWPFGDLGATETKTVN